MQGKILLIDDDTDLLTLLSMSFKEAGLDIRTASSGLEALKKARSFLPDVILLDLMLPEMDGFTICEILKKDKDTALIPVIMLTGLSSQFGRIAGLECGADDYVMKPFKVEEVLAKVSQYLPKSHAAA